MKHILTLLFSVIFFPLFSQTIFVKGIVKDNKRVPLSGAVVELIQTKDSARITLAVTDENGLFSIAAKNPGRYNLKISYLGFDDLIIAVNVIDQGVFLEEIKLQEKSTLLKSAIITGEQVSSVQKGDTTQFNAGAFKTNVDATAEDLVTKLPGVNVVDGKVQAQGENITQVLVDGKPFFGDDPNAVLKNLPAEVIDKIQVFDKKSDQATFTGVDDGNTTKTINIITKPKFRNGKFGKVYGGYGYEEKYKAGLAYNNFYEKKRVTILALMNNINEQNFSSDDLSGVMSSPGGGGRGGEGRRGGGNRGPTSGTDASSFLVDQAGGVVTTNAVGVNYVNTWGLKTEVSASYFFNQTKNFFRSNTYRMYVLEKQSGLTYDQLNSTESENINHRGNARLEWKADTNNSVLFTPRFSTQQNERTSQLLGNNNLENVLLNSTWNTNTSTNFGLNVSAPVLFRHKFSKPGRTISLQVSPNYNPGNSDNSLLSTTSYYSLLSETDSLNQLSHLQKHTKSLSNSLSYTESISDAHSLELAYNNSFASNTSDKKTNNAMNFPVVTELLDTALSSTFRNLYNTHSAGLWYRFRKRSIMTNMGASFQSATLSNDQQFPISYQVNRTFYNVLPRVMMRISLPAKSMLRIHYRTSTNAPSVTQLQEVVNNSNPTQLSVGNSKLKQDYSHALFLRYSSSDTKKSSTFFALLSGTMTNNYIGNHSIIASGDTMVQAVLLQKGGQLSTPVNLHNYSNARALVTFGFPVYKIRSNLNFNLSANYTRTPGMINSQLNMATSPNASVGFVLTSNVSEKLDFLLSTTSTINRIENSLTSDLNSNYFSQTSRFKINWVFYKNLALQSEVTHQLYSGLSTTFDQQYYLWNGGISVKFMKKKNAELRIFVFDILEQNNSIQRISTDTYVEDTRSNVLERYFMLNFTYNFRTYSKEKKEE